MAIDFRKWVKGILVQNESDKSKEVRLTVDNSASSGTNSTIVAKQTLSRSLDLPDTSGVLVEKDFAQTLTNKTIDGDTNTVQDLALSSLKTVLGDADKFVSRDVSGQVVATKAVPVGTVVGNSDTQILTNKTIDADSNTISNIENADIKVGAAIDAAKIHNGSVSNTEFGYLDGVTSAIQTQLTAKAQISGATDNRLVRTDGATGIQQSGIAVDDVDNISGVNSLTINGNLTVSGTTTTINTATLSVTDANITVNNGGTNITAEGSGLTVDRVGTDGSLVYEDALASKWKAGALGAEIQLANVSSAQTLTNKNLKSNTNLLTGAKANTFERETGNQQIVTIPDVTTGDTFVTQAHSQVLTNKDIDGGTASNTSRLTVPKDTLANLLLLTRKEGTILYATDTDKFYRDDGTNLQEIGSGSGERNFITNGDAEAGTTGWATYADAAATRPVDGTGGAASVTFTRSTGSPLEGTGSFLFTKDAVNRQGQGVSYDFTVDSAYKAKVLQIQFDYIVSSGTFVAGSTSTDSDVIAYIYDVTNSTLIEPSSIKLLSNSATISDKFRASFQTSATGTNYRLILHCASTSASAYVLKIDNIKVSPSNYVFGTPVTDWQTFTPTGTWTTNTTYTGRYRRIGDTAEIQYNLVLAGAPNAVVLTLNMPAGLTIDTSKFPGTILNDNAILGDLIIKDSGTNSFLGTIAYGGTTSTLTPGYMSEAATVLTAPAAINATSPITFAVNDQIGVTARVPIFGWSSSVQTSDQADTRTIAIQGNGTPNNTVTASLSKATFPSSPITIDTHGAWSTVNNYYVVPSSGIYKSKFSSEISQTTVLGSAVQVAIVRRNAAGVIQETFSGFDRAFGAGTTTQYAIAEAIHNCSAGDTIEFQTQANGTAPTYSSSLAGTQFNIQKISGPSAIAASEKVYAEYTTGSGQSMTGAANTRINYNTKIRDSHNAVTTGASWVFTAPRAEVYEVEACFAGSAQAAASQKILSLFKNGTEYRRLARDRNTAASADDQPGLGATSIYLLSGETIDIRGFLSTTQNLTTADLDNWVTIKSHGGV